MKCANCHKQNDYTVCYNCWNYALEHLDKFPARYYELERELIPSVSVSKGERIQSSRDGSPIPVRLETLHLRSGGISKPLMAHETTMRTIRQETRITFRGEEINKITKTTTYIKTHSAWAFKEYEAIDELTKDIITIAHKIQYVLGHKSDEVTIGKCPTQDQDGKKCGSTLKIDPSKLDKTSEIKCRRCDTVWDSTKWRLLGRILDERN